LKGREAQGIVEPGAEYELLCDKIISGLKTFVDADSGNHRPQGMLIACGKGIEAGTIINHAPFWTLLPPY
jgi:hypothetical protein